MTPEEIENEKSAAKLKLFALMCPFLSAALESAERQLIHSLTNSEEPVTLQVERAFREGIVAAHGKLHSWDMLASTLLAAELLANVNAHELAAPLYTQIQAWEEERE